MVVTDGQGDMLVRHNVTLAALDDARPAASAPLADAQLVAPNATPIPANDRITADRLVTWIAAGGTPMRGVVIEALLGDRTPIHIAIARNMRDRAALLDGYRDRLKLAGGLGALFALLLGYGLIRTALEPLREIVDNTGRITVDKLDTRLDASRARARAAGARRCAECDARPPAAGVLASVAIQRRSRARPADAAEQHARATEVAAAAAGRRIPGAARIASRGIRPARADDRQRAVPRARRASELRHAAAGVRRARRTRTHRRVFRGKPPTKRTTLRVEGQAADRRRRAVSPRDRQPARERIALHPGRRCHHARRRRNAGCGARRRRQSRRADRSGAAAADLRPVRARRPGAAAVRRAAPPASASRSCGR